MRSEPVLPTSTRWERAYQAFESPEQEVRKFTNRLRSMGVEAWDRRLRILEICSGRGSGLRAWHTLGFADILGVDSSYALVAAHQGAGRCVLGDARSLPLGAASRDVAVVQGGLHHLFTKDDVELALKEMGRVVGPRGRIIIVEPWLTPFLRFVHVVTAQQIARRAWRKLDTLATMIEEERDTYEGWLNAPDEYLSLIKRYVRPQFLRRRWGKLMVVGWPIE